MRDKGNYHLHSHTEISTPKVSLPLTWMVKKQFSAIVLNAFPVIRKYVILPLHLNSYIQTLWRKELPRQYQNHVSVWSCTSPGFFWRVMLSFPCVYYSYIHVIHAGRRTQDTSMLKYIQMSSNLRVRVCVCSAWQVNTVVQNTVLTTCGHPVDTHTHTHTDTHRVHFSIITCPDGRLTHQDTQLHTSTCTGNARWRIQCTVSLGVRNLSNTRHETHADTILPFFPPFPLQLQHVWRQTIYLAVFFFSFSSFFPRPRLH